MGECDQKTTEEILDYFYEQGKTQTHSMVSKASMSVISNFVRW